jgi:hypothetical protein
MTKAIVSPEYLWTLTVPRWNSAIDLAVSAVFGIFFNVMLWRAGTVTKPNLVAALFWLVSGSALFAFQAFARCILWPPIAMAVTTIGFMTFFRQDRMDYGSPGVLVPWPVIKSISYKFVRTSRRTRMHALAIQLEPDHCQLIPRAMAAQDTIYFDVWSERTGHRVVARLTELQRHFTSERSPAP